MSAVKQSCGILLDEGRKVREIGAAMFSMR